MIRLTLLAVVLVGCVVPEPEGPDPTVCEVTMALEGDTKERLVAQLAAPDRPTLVQLFREDGAHADWTYDYDDEDRILAMHAQQVGVGDWETTYEHAELATTIRYSETETVVVTLDANERVIGTSQPTGTTTYELAPSGAVMRMERDAIDVDTQMPYTRSEVMTYDPAGRITGRTVDDSRFGTPSMFAWSYAGQGNELTIMRTGSGIPETWTYTYDAEGRPVRAVEGDWIVELEYGSLGGVTTRGSRDGVPGWMYDFSGGCTFRPRVPQAPTSGTRPGPQWTYLLPAIPNAY